MWRAFSSFDPLGKRDDEVFIDARARRQGLLIEETDVAMALDGCTGKGHTISYLIEEPRFSILKRLYFKLC